MIENKIFLFSQVFQSYSKKLSTHFLGGYVLIPDPFKKIKFASLLLIYIFIPLDPLTANQSNDYQEIDMLVLRCYKNTKFCKEALFKINDYQKNAAKNKKYSCQTRLLGLEANLIMAMNSNFKRKEAKNIFDSIKKYC